MMNHVYLIVAVATILKTSDSYKIVKANWTICHHVALHEDSYQSHLCEVQSNKRTKEGNPLIECEKEHPDKNNLFEQYVALNKVTVPEKNNTPFFCLGQYSMRQDYGSLMVEMKFNYSRVIGAARILEKGRHLQGVKLKLQISKQQFYPPSAFSYRPKDKEFWIGLYNRVPTDWLLNLKIVSHNSTSHCVPIRRSYFSKLSSTTLKEIEIFDHSIEERLTLPSLPHLRKLILQRVNLTFIDGFHAAPNLEEVDLSGNYIKNMPQVFSHNFQKLRILNLSRNRIHFMFLGIGFPTDSYGRVSKSKSKRLPLLRELDLSHNEIKDLTFPFTYPLVPSLGTLNLSYCQIDYLPIERQNPFRYMPSLLYLDLSHNNIMHLSQTSLLVNQKINLIDLSANRLVEWPVFDYCNIRFLNLSGNNYTSLKKLSLNHSKIEYIDLSRNMISAWNETDIFCYPKELESGIAKVNLSYNPIITLSEEMLISLKALRGIDIGNSSADCVELLTRRGSEHMKKIYSLGRRSHPSCNVTTELEPPTPTSIMSALPVYEDGPSTYVVGTAVMLPLVLLYIVAIYCIVFRLRFVSLTQRC